MILGKVAIRERLRDGQIFKNGTWVEESIMEASYALRVASNGLLLGGKRYKPGKDSIDKRIEIKPGEIAILSTKERLNMPGDLVGKLGLRFNYATQGLTGLMGIQVDPFLVGGMTMNGYTLEWPILVTKQFQLILVPMCLRSNYTKFKGMSLLLLHLDLPCGTASKMF